MKILLLTGHFPPENSGGCARPFSLYRHLPENGINVIVVTKNLFGKLPREENVFRYDSLWSWRQSPIFSKKIFYKITTLIKNAIYGINPDGWWTNEVVKNFSEFSSAKDIKLIYATFPGVEALEAAIKLKNKLNVPLIVEFRDGLSFETVLKKPNFIQKKIIKNFENRIVHACDCVVTIGETLSKYFSTNYQKPVFTVYNGYEQTDFDVTGGKEPDKKHKKYLVHFGSLNSSRAAKRDGLFKALKNLKDKNIIHQNNFCLQFIGNIKEKEIKNISRYPLNEIISFLPQMHKKEGFSFIKSHADYLLFYGVPDSTTIVSAKLPEYLKLGKPILGICKGNEAETIIKKTRTGEVCDFDERSIENLLLKLVKNQILYQPDENEISRFDRKQQAIEIAKIIENVMDHQAKK